MALALLPATAGAHTAHGRPVVEISGFAFRPATVVADVGDPVLWKFAGPDTNHSVTADAGQETTFDSDEGTPPEFVNHPVDDVYAVTFEKPGSYRYHCKVHAGMTGTVSVHVGPSDGDPTTPRLTKVSLEPARRSLLVRFTLSEPAVVRATVRRMTASGPSRKVLASSELSRPPGPGRRRIALGTPAPGRYQVALVAIDASTGAATAPLRRIFTIRA